MSEILNIGDYIGEFEITSTHGRLNFSEFNADSWVILLALPIELETQNEKDLISYSNQEEYFRLQQTKILGYSVRPQNELVPWIDGLSMRATNVHSIPIICDPEYFLTPRLGIKHMRKQDITDEIFVIDPAGRIRQILSQYEDSSRSMRKIKRALAKIQNKDKGLPRAQRNAFVPVAPKVTPSKKKQNPTPSNQAKKRKRIVKKTIIEVPKFKDNSQG
jgi:peroxiredoxin (alkyl hydroperoxide reductase subunit C)